MKLADFTHLAKCARLLCPKKRMSVFHAQLAVAKDFGQQAGANGFPRVNRDDGCPAVFMAKKMVTATYAHDDESGLTKRSDEFGTSEARASAHAAITIR